MKVYIPFRKDSAVHPMNTLSGIYGDTEGGKYLRSMQAFHRKKDAVAFMEEMNTRYPFMYKIVAFTYEAK